MIGRTVSHYEILEPLGAGGMGVLYKARDKRLNRVLALKFLPPDYLKDTSRREKFVQEAVAASALDHPNICTIYEIGDTEDGQLFIAMAYYEGETLRQTISRGPLPIETAVNYTLQVAQGLLKAHGKHITHRDIKPLNLIVTRDGNVKIIDFGLAEMNPDPDATRLASGIVGTPAYMSPEQASGWAVDGRTDMWALGAVLYEMLTGKQAFTSWESLMNRDPEPIGNVRIVPLWLDRVVRKALSKRPGDRYQHIAEMIADLQTSDVRQAARLASPVADSANTPSSIAVMPLENLSPDRENEYFSDGLTEELIVALGQLEGLRVVSRTSVFEFKGKAQNIRKIADSLNVSTLLEGSVFRAGNRVRIIVRLINAADGYQIWTERYNREMKDVFEVQEEIAQTIAQRLKVQLKPGPQRTLTKPPSADIEAYQTYLEGRYHWHKRNPVGLQTAFERFQKALAIDPNYAAAHTGLSDCYAVLAIYGLAPAQQAWGQAKAQALKALELDGMSAGAHTALGQMLMFHEWQWQEASREFLIAAELNPGHVEAYISHSFLLMMQGRLHQALVSIKRAQELDPLSSDVRTYEAMILTYLGNHDRSVEIVQRTLELQPNSIELYYTLGLAYQQKGLMDEAIAAFEKGRELSGNSPLLLGWLGACYAAAGRRVEALKIIDQLNSRNDILVSIPWAVIYAGLGERDLAFEWLQKAADKRDALLCYIKVTPTYAPLRGDPRYQSLLHKMGLD